jgi:hypothetical protein
VYATLKACIDVGMSLKELNTGLKRVKHRQKVRAYLRIYA